MQSQSSKDGSLQPEPGHGLQELVSGIVQEAIDTSDIQTFGLTAVVIQPIIENVLDSIDYKEPEELEEPEEILAVEETIGEYKVKEGEEGEEEEGEEDDEDEEEYKKSEKHAVFQLPTDIKHKESSEEEEDIQNCDMFLDVHKQAEKVISEIIDNSLGKMVEHKILETSVDSTGDEANQEPQYDTSSLWPTIQDFNIDCAIESICRYLDTWYYEENWLYCVDFLVEQSDACSDFYMFEVKWSIPTKRYPIPQATASIYFTIEVSRVKPSLCPVSVTYIFEGSHTVHTPESSFSESWLFNIIDAKLNFYKTLTF